MHHKGEADVPNGKTVPDRNGNCVLTNKRPDHTAGGSAEHGSKKPVDLDARIEEEEEDKAAALEHDEEDQEDDEVNRAAKNNAVRTNYPRG